MNQVPRVLVWDIPVRVFHWLLVFLVAVSWWTGETGGTALRYHFWSGYAILALVLFRLGWGVIGSEPARFASFLRGPRAVLANLRALPRRTPDESLGHNPAGGWMIAALLATLLVQIGSGLCANDDLFNEGPWYDLVSRSVSDTLTGLHHLNFGVLLTLVALHVLAIVFHWRVKGENLVAPMFTGYKRRAAPPPRQTSAWYALVLLALAAAITGAAVNL
ncbi:MAG: cytochrome b/b6 domain-containing protein [Gammaproteobacteria bacterium]